MTGRRFAAGLGMFVLMLAWSPLHARTKAAIEGIVTHVRDGDTIVVDGTAVRLQGIAAPERLETLGPEAGSAMRLMVDRRRLRCEPDGTRTRDRIVAVCWLDDRDIGAMLVQAGLARDCPRYSKGRYAADEAAARSRGALIAATYTLPRYCDRR